MKEYIDACEKGTIKRVKEDNMGLLFKILLQMTELSNYDSRDFIDEAYLMFNKGCLIRNIVMISLKYLLKLDRKITENAYDDDLYLHWGIIGRGLVCMSNLMYENEEKFYEVNTSTELYEAIYAVVVLFHKYGRKIKNCYISYVYIQYSLSIYWIASLVNQMPLDISDTVINTFSIIFDTIFSPNTAPIYDFKDAIIRWEFEDYEEIVATAYATIALMMESGDDVVFIFMQSEGHLKLMKEIITGALQSKSKMANNCLVKVSSILHNISRNSFDHELEKHRIYPLIFEILRECSDDRVWENLWNAISKFLVSSRHIVEDIDNPLNLQTLVRVAIETRSSYVKTSVWNLFLNISESQRTFDRFCKYSLLMV